MLRLQAQKYIISNGQIYWKDLVGVLLLCLVEGENHKVIEEFHGGVCGGHYNWKTTSHKILKARFYWPTLFGKCVGHVRSAKYLLRDKKFPLSP